MTRHHYLVVNLVADDKHLVVETYLCDTQEFVARPHSSRGVVRIAKQHYRHVGVRCFPLQVVEVDVIGLVFVNQRTLDYLASAVSDAGEEAVVDGCLYQYLLTG